ncbi:hypothetical protein EE612_053806, partial [Oryza sativa]
TRDLQNSDRSARGAAHGNPTAGCDGDGDAAFRRSAGGGGQSATQGG